MFNKFLFFIIFLISLNLLAQDKNPIYEFIEDRKCVRPPLKQLAPANFRHSVGDVECTMVTARHVSRAERTNHDRSTYDATGRPVFADGGVALLLWMVARLRRDAALLHVARDARGRFGARRRQRRCA